jgi:hypothetical protein
MNTNQEASFEGIWKHGNKTVDIKVSLIIFNDSDNVVAYCPALDLSGYGKNEDEAIESFKVVSGEYFLYSTNKDTFLKDLQQHGWKLPRHKHQNPVQPEMSYLLRTNSEFNRVFNNFPFKKIDHHFAIPA